MFFNADTNSHFTRTRPSNSIDQMIEMKAFHHVYQPIFQLLTNTIAGYEALLRSPPYPPEYLFNLAFEERRLFELDITSIYHSISMFFTTSYNQSDFPVFINIFPSTIAHPCFPCFIEQCLSKIPQKNIVFEINEIGSVEDYALFRKVTSYLREEGYRIAIDDVGAGASSIPKIVELQPDIIKLDRYLSDNLAHSVPKQRLIDMFVHYCREDIQLILEGIEKPGDLAVAKSLGIQVGQGFLLGKPMPLPLVKVDH